MEFVFIDKKRDTGEHKISRGSGTITNLSGENGAWQLRRVRARGCHNAGGLRQRRLFLVNAHGVRSAAFLVRVSSARHVAGGACAMLIIVFVTTPALWTKTAQIHEKCQ